MVPEVGSRAIREIFVYRYRLMYQVSGDEPHSRRVARSNGLRAMVAASVRLPNRPLQLTASSLTLGIRS